MLVFNKNRFGWWLSLGMTMLALALFLGFGSVAVASEDGSSHSGGQGSSHVSKGKGGSSGHDSGSDDHGSSTHVKGKGKGSHGGGGAGSDAVTRDRGRRPVWAQEGLPDVELGRLNAARAPDHVLSRALAEAHEALAADPLADVHSPPQNLALYWEAMTSQSKWTRAQAATFLATAADKRTPITTDTVKALNLILGVSDSNPEAMAQEADSLRQQILADHDEGGSDGH